MCASLPKRIPYSSKEGHGSVGLGECINRRDRTAAPSKSYPQSSQGRILPESVTHQLWSSLKLCKLDKAEEFLQSHSHTGTKCNKTRLDCYQAARKDLEDGTRLSFSIQAKSDVRMPQLLSVLLVTAAQRSYSLMSNTLPNKTVPLCKLSFVRTRPRACAAGGMCLCV